MNIDNRNIDSLDDVKKFIKDVAWYYGIEIYEDDIQVTRYVDEISSIINGAPKYWFDYDDQSNYELEGEDWVYRYNKQINSSKKVVWNEDKSVDFCTPEQLLNGNKHRAVSDEEIEKLQELEEKCIEICNDEGYWFADLVLEEANNRRYEEEMRAESDARWAEDEIREANRSFNDMMNDNEAWGNID